MGKAIVELEETLDKQRPDVPEGNQSLVLASPCDNDHDDEEQGKEDDRRDH
jgi:hypothetical protein